MVYGEFKRVTGEGKSRGKGGVFKSSGNIKNGISIETTCYKLFTRNLLGSSRFNFQLMRLPF